MIRSKPLLEELRNISRNEPMWPGETISHATANELVEMGWAERDADGSFVTTAEGRAVAGRVTKG